LQEQLSNRFMVLLPERALVLSNKEKVSVQESGKVKGDERK
jgi:hypothetical protein